MNIHLVPAGRHVRRLSPQPDRLVLIVASPSRGKSSLVRNFKLNLKVGDSGTPSPAARPCRRHRPMGGCWVRPAGMCAGYPRSPIGLVSSKPNSG